MNTDKVSPPSRNIEKHWLRALNQFRHVSQIYWRLRQYPRGYFCIFISVDQLDQAWSVVERATKDGLLGYFASCRTIKEKCGEKKYSKKVICIFNHPWDRVDRRRIEDVLNQMGLGEYQRKYKIKFHA